MTFLRIVIPLYFCLSMISAQTRSAFVARENRYPLFRIMLQEWSTDVRFDAHFGLTSDIALSLSAPFDPAIRMPRIFNLFLVPDRLPDSAPPSIMLGDTRSHLFNFYSFNSICARSFSKT
jgi:hypothetical protein